MNRADQIALRRRRQGAWLSTCAMATALAVTPHVAQAQAFQGTPTIVTGAGSIATGTGTTSISLKGSQTVINWTPTDVVGSGTIDFLPAGTTATFDSGADFTVLNRILPVDGVGNPTARMVSLNGTVNSTIGAPSGFTGGNVWFYTPTGLIVGPTATMNVGGLILTTDDIQFTPNPPGGFGSIYGPGGVIQFRGPAGSKGLVDVQAGAQLNAVGATSYIAMVAPRIQQGGVVSAERSVGYIAAEQADLTINAGLFDISILAGTTDPNGIVHTGTTTGTASTSGFDAKTISFVALPKATALTMLLSGSIGYAPAADAFNDGSAVVLSSGYTTDQPTAEAAGSLGNISIDNASFANPTVAFASGKLDITAAGGAVSFGAFTNLHAQDAIGITLGAGEQLTAADSLLLNTASAGKGGTVDISVGGGKSLFRVTNSLDIGASNSATPFGFSPPPIATGGKVTVDVNGGQLSAGNIYADTEGYASYDSTTAAPATGGTISFTARNGGVIAATDFSTSVDAYSGYNNTTSGDAAAGSVSLISQNGLLNLGSVELDAEAFAAGGTVTSGTATGGTATVSLSGGTYNWDSLTGYTTAFAGYTAGSQGNSAAVPSDAMTLTLANSATLNVANDIYLDASALATVDGAPGTNAHGGGIAFDIGAGSALKFTNLFAYAEAGVNLSYFDGVTPTLTPDVTGGTINFTTAGLVSGSSLHLNAQAAELGASSTSGTARGGTVDMLVNGGGNIALDDGSGTAVLTLNANGLGAIGSSPANAIGGSATLSIADGSVDVAGTIGVYGRGQWYGDSAFIGSGPDPRTGFDARGGLATVELLPGTSGTASLTASSLIVDAAGDASTPAFDYTNIGDGGPPSGTYGGPMFANGGDGTGGTAKLSVAAGALDLGSGGAVVEATGQGGISAGSTLGTAFQSGNGFGGVANVGITGGTGTLGSLEVDAFGVGGGGAFAGGVGELPALAGFGLGGNARLSLGGGSFSPASLVLDATGTGGEGGGSDADQAGTDGGDGLGGVAGLISPSGATGTLTSANVLILAGGAGGAGGFGTTEGNGGDGIGGAAVTNLADGAFALGPVILGADGDGGGGLLGGQGTGGSANFKLADSTGPTGARTIGSLSLYANGIGGTGGSGPGASDAGSTGLDVEAFDTASGLGITGDFLADSEGANAPVGQGFTALFGGAPLTVGGNSTITTSRDAVISGTQKFHTTGDLTITARSLSASAPLAADGNVAIDALNGISLGSLTSGGTTGLTASNGAITAADLRSAGLVTATGRSLLIESGAGLTFANATATAGDLKIVTTGGLTSNGPVSATGNVALIGNGGLSAGTVTSGGTTTLNAANGAVTVTDLHSPGLVSASGQSVDIASPGALTFGETSATAGDLTLTALDLAATGPLSASGNVILDAANGIALGALSSGGTTDLTASNGAISATDLRSASPVTASGRSIAIASGGGLTFASANATAGDLAISTALGLTATGPLAATGGVALSGGHGIAAGTVTSGGTTSLGAANGAIGVSDLTSSGAVSASGESIAIASGGGLTFANAHATAGDLSLTALDFTATGPLSATGNVAIDAANGIAAGTLTSGGTTGLTSDGAIAATDLNSGGLVTAVGSSLDIGSSGALDFAVAKATGGDLAIATAGDLALANASSTGGMTLSSSGGRITSSGSLVSGGAFSASGALGLDFASLSTSGTTTLTATGGAITIDDVVQAGPITARGRSIAIGSSGGLDFDQANATAGDLSLTTAGLLTVGGASSATGNVNLAGATGVAAAGTLSSGGTTVLTATGGNVAVSALTSAGAVTASGQSVSIVSPGALTFDTAAATAGDLSIQALDLAASGELSATGNVSLDGDNGLALGRVTSGGTTGLRADSGTILITDLRSPGVVEAFGQSMNIVSGGALHYKDAVASAGEVTLYTVGNLVSENTSATGDVSLNSSDGQVHAIGHVGGANVYLDAGGDVRLDRDLDTSGVLQVSAGGTFGLGGTASADRITVSSADVDLAAGAQLGARGTTESITLVPNTPTAPLLIGGTGQAGTYSLDGDEAGRLFADQSIFIGSSAGEGNGIGEVTLGDLSLSYGTNGNIGIGGQFGIFTGSTVTVNGAVQLSTRSADDTFSIDPALIDVVAGQGSIAMQSATGAAQGTLSLTADRIVVATSEAFDAIGGLTDLAQISQALDKPGAAGPAGGYLQAGTIDVTARNAFLVQNGGASDAYADRRGFTANELAITTGSAATQIAINGVILQGGNSVTGLDTAPLITINDAPAAAGGQFDALSTINGCVIGADCAAPPPPPPPEEPPVTNPTDDDLTGPIDHPTGVVFSDQLFSLGDNAPLITPPLVDEPITGVGNDDLWISGCSDNPDDKRCADKKGGD